MTSARGTGAPSRRELAAVLLAGAAGAGAVLLASRQGLARVVVLAPAPLPASVTEVTAQDVRPAIGALAIAALASLAAVLATRGLLRRITGLATAALGAGAGLLAAGRITAAQALAAARASAASAAAGQGAGAAGSVSAGGTAQGAGAGLPISGMPAHVTTSGGGWQVLLIAGALMLVAAGLTALARADRLPVMSARYDRHRPAVGREDGAAGGLAAGAAGRAGRPARRDGLWEALSAGDDPTA